MRNSVRKIFAALTAAVVFVSVLMVCCICLYRSSPDRTGRETPDTPDTPESADIIAYKRSGGEMRGLWVPYFSLYSEDSSGSMSEKTFRRRFSEIVAQAKRHGVNTLFVQVRPNCDAAYPSDIFPFSDIYLIDGKEPDYDPLAFMIETAHASGMELHAWINPYRILSSGTVIPDNSPCKKWEGNERRVIVYNGGVYMNPASAEVRSLIIDGVRELAHNYDVDGIHLDDYFYAFTESGIDEADYSEYLNSLSRRKTPLTLQKWRCANVNTLIAGIYSAVKSEDNSIVFGIAPQGNPDNDLAMGADVYEWCGENGYIDYLAPQIYFNSENPVCPYEKMTDEFRKMITADGVEYYVGLALYKAGSDEDDGTWHSGSIIASQIEYARSAGADGYILYSADYLEDAATAEEIRHYDELILGE